MAREPRAILDLRIPFFRQVWRRVVLVGVLGLWAVVEITAGNPWWALLAGGLMVYSIREFFIATSPADFEAEGDD